VVFGADGLLARSAAGLQAELTFGDASVPNLVEHPLPWADGRLAACVSWATGGAPTVATAELSLRPGRASPAPGLKGVNLHPDPRLEHPIHSDGKAAIVDAWRFGAYGKARAYERKAEIAERAPGEAPSIRVEPSQPGNWYVIFWKRPNFAVEPGRSYTFLMRHFTETTMSGMVQIHYAWDDSVTPEAKKKYDLTPKPWAYPATPGWRPHITRFTAPEGALGATVHIKVSTPGALWLRDFAAVPDYEPIFRVTALDEEYGLADREARFRVDLDLSRQGLAPAAAEAPEGVEVWELLKAPEDVANRLRVFVGSDDVKGSPAAATSRGIVTVPLPGKPGAVDVRFRLYDRRGQVFAEVRRTLEIRANVSDL